MKKVLIITYYWPPGSGPGVQRFLKFSKYLQEFGWEPMILTVENGSYPSIDFSLVKDIPEGLKVFKTKTFEPFQWYNILKGKKGKSTGVGMVGMQEKNLLQKFALHIRANYFIPDARKGWEKYALKKAKSILQEEHIDAIITTGPPHSAHLIGLDLKKQMNLPWIADMRDPWTTVFYNEFLPRTEATKQKDKTLEDSVLQSADGVAVVSNGLKEEFSDRNDNISIIYNGFDETDLPLSVPQRNKRFTISYVGNFKPNQNVEILWEVFSEIKKDEIDFSADLELFITGNIDISVIKSIQFHGLQDNLSLSPFVAHQEAVHRMNSADMLLFVIPRSERNKLIITGKLFEYLATGNSILGIGPVDGDASALLQEVNREPLSDYLDKKSIKSQVLAAYKNWKNKESKRLELVDLKRFSRKGLTEQLANKLNDLLDEN